MNSNINSTSRRGQSSPQRQQGRQAAQSWRTVIFLICAFCTGILFECALNPCLFDDFILQTKTAKDKNNGNLRSNSLPQNKQSAAAAALSSSSSGPQDQKMRQWGYDAALVDNESYMQFMNYNQICHLKLKSDEETTIDN
eukprot:scaffold33543_cov174-Skeletonema_dohrnii-CCMP3373.AAC.3